MVSLQRMILLGQIKIDTKHLGEWVVQYGHHLKASITGPSQARRSRSQTLFDFKPNDWKKQYNGPHLTFSRLSAQIMRYKDNTEPKSFAKQWDRAIEAWYKFKVEREHSGGGNEFKELISKLEIIQSMDAGS
jgi:hypothetical protein